MVCHLRSSTQWQRVTPHGSPLHHADWQQHQQQGEQQQGEQLGGQDRLSTEDLEALEGQVVYELGGSGGTTPVPLAGGEGARQFLGHEAAALEPGAARDAGSGAAGGFSTGGLQQLAAKLRNGSQTPDRAGLAHAAGGSGRYASYEDSVESKQSGPAGLAGPSRRGPGGISGVPGEAGPGSGRRGRVPPLHLSRVSVADLLHASDEPPNGAAGSPAEQLQRVSKQAAASISRLAESMHSSGMGAVTPGDIRAALSGEQLPSLRKPHSLVDCPLRVSLCLLSSCLAAHMMVMGFHLLQASQPLITQVASALCPPLPTRAAMRSLKATAATRRHQAAWRRTWRQLGCSPPRMSTCGACQRKVTTPTWARQLAGPPAATQMARQQQPSMQPLQQR